MTKHGNRRITHKKLIKWAQRQDREAGTLMLNLKLKREDADYDHDVLYDMRDEVAACLSDAEQLLETISKWAVREHASSKANQAAQQDSSRPESTG